MNPELYAKTAFILNYDEGGQFVDHHWTPTPPRNSFDGNSTVTVEGELIKEPYTIVPKGSPIGMGFRVPFFIVSPWTRVKGGQVYSEVADHTSVLKLIEQKFGIEVPTISPWRRAVAGNLLNAFNFSNPDYSWPTFPNQTGNFNKTKAQCANLPPPVVPKKQSMPVQVQGVKQSNALPYAFAATFTANKLRIENKGAAGAAFQVHNYLIPGLQPYKYTVEAGKTLENDLFIVSGGNYSYYLHGPNGFVRGFEGIINKNTSAIGVAFQEEPESNSVVITSSVSETLGKAASGCDDSVLTVTDNAYNLGGPWTLTPGKSLGL